MVISVLKAILLGIVEGVTEFLPVSSTGHLILVNEWVSFGEPFTAMFDVVIQLGAILAVVVFFWKKLWPFNKDKVVQKEIFSIWKKTLAGVVPALFLGWLLGDFIETRLFTPFVVAIALIIGGIILIFIERREQEGRFDRVEVVPWLIVFCIGFIQCLALIPGTSRAAATIIGGLLLGLTRVAAVEFSFFLAIPTMVAASTYSLLKHGLSLTGSEIFVLLVGFVTAFIVALSVIKLFMKYIQAHTFKTFGYYRVVLGILVLLYFTLR